MQSGICWRFQSAKGCDGTCLWPHTHQCYSCGRDHSIRLCLLGDTQTAPNLYHQCPFLPWRGEYPNAPQGSLEGTTGRQLPGMTRGGSPSKKSGQLLATRHDILGGCPGDIWEGGKTSSCLTDDLRDEDWRKVKPHQRTPVKFATMGTMLADAGCDAARTHYLVGGFRQGFRLRLDWTITQVVHNRKNNVRRVQGNNKTALTNPLAVEEKLKNESRAKRMIRPFLGPVSPDYVISPLGLRK